MALRDLVGKIEKSIHDSARLLKGNLNASGVLGTMVDMVFGRNNTTGRSVSDEDATAVDAAASASASTATATSTAFGNALDHLPDAESVAELFCGEVRESWEDALDGILSVGVKRYA